MTIALAALPESSEWGCSVATARSSSLASAANTSTLAPAAASSSAFQAAAGLSPATTARLPASPKKTGSRASGSIRGVRVSEGIRDALIEDDPFELRQARAAIRAGAQRPTDVPDVGCAAAADGLAHGIEPDLEAGPNDRLRRPQLIVHSRRYRY